MGCGPATSVRRRGRSGCANPHPEGAGTSATTEAVNPGRTLGIIGLILAFSINVVGPIVSIVALRESTKAGFENGPATAGIVVSILIVGAAIVAGIAAAATAATAASQCAEYGAGVHELDSGVTLACG